MTFTITYRSSALWNRSNPQVESLLHNHCSTARMSIQIISRLHKPMKRSLERGAISRKKSHLLQKQRGEGMQQMRDERGQIQCKANHNNLQQARQHVPGQFTEPADHRVCVCVRAWVCVCVSLYLCWTGAEHISKTNSYVSCRLFCFDKLGRPGSYFQFAISIWVITWQSIWQ
jgi:hypothetical protein